MSSSSIDSRKMIVSLYVKLLLYIYVSRFETKYLNLPYGSQAIAIVIFAET
jgi:hypothetical protein